MFYRKKAQKTRKAETEVCFCLEILKDLKYSIIKHYAAFVGQLVILHDTESVPRDAKLWM